MAHLSWPGSYWSPDRRRRRPRRPRGHDAVCTTPWRSGRVGSPAIVAIVTETTLAVITGVGRLRAPTSPAGRPLDGGRTGVVSGNASKPLNSARRSGQSALRPSHPR